MKNHASAVRPLPVLLGVLGLLLLGGCATEVQPFTVSAQHPANPQAARGAPAPADLSLLAPAAALPAAEKPAETETAPAHTHKHDS
jgi:hypothetical protein